MLERQHVDIVGPEIEQVPLAAAYNTDRAAPAGYWG
jgi:hypothetical protein